MFKVEHVDSVGVQLVLRFTFLHARAHASASPIQMTGTCLPASSGPSPVFLLLSPFAFILLIVFCCFFLLSMAPPLTFRQRTYLTPKFCHKIIVYYVVYAWIIGLQSASKYLLTFIQHLDVLFIFLSLWLDGDDTLTSFGMISTRIKTTHSNYLYL